MGVVRTERRFWRRPLPNLRIDNPVGHPAPHRNGCTATVAVPSARALAALVAGAVMISFSGVWVKIAHVTPLSSAFYRVFFGGLFLLAATVYRGELRARPPRLVAEGLLCGLLFALDLTFYHISIHYIGPGLGTILPNFQVFILTAIGVCFLGEKLRVVFVAAVPLAVAGLFLIVGTDWNGLGARYQTGIVCGMLAAACYAGFLLALRRLQGQQMGLSFFYVLMLVSFTSAAFIGAEMVRRGEPFAIPDVQTGLALGALALLSQAVGWILIANALPRLRTSLAGLLLLLQPALAFVWDVILFGRPTTSANWLGVGMVLTAIYLGTLKRRPRSAPDKNGRKTGIIEGKDADR